MPDQDTIAHYLESLASAAATPGGGTVAALTGAQAAGLVSMVCRLTRDHRDEIHAIHLQAESSMAAFRALADEDMEKFNAVMTAYKLPKAQRSEDLSVALTAAADVPLRVISQVLTLAPGCIRLATIGNKNLITDTGIAALLLASTIQASRLNVQVNLNALPESEFVRATRRELDESAATVTGLRNTFDDITQDLGSG